MTIEAIIKNLHHHQKWRRGNTKETLLSPQELGKTIDEAIRLLRQLKNQKHNKSFKNENITTTNK